MADIYWVWALDRDNMPLATEGPWGPYDSQTARTYARISATEGKHDRAVSRGQDPQASGFEIMRIYRAGSGEHVYAGQGVTANGMQRNKTTIKSLTESQIRRLRSEAAAAGDYEMVAICDLALNGEIDTDDYTTLSSVESRRVSKMTQDDAYAAIVRAINDAEAQEHESYEENEARPHSELNWYKITYSAPTGGTAVTHVRAPNSAEAIERAAFQIGYKPDVWSIEGMLNGEWTRL